MNTFGKLVLGVVACVTVVGAIALIVKKLDEHSDLDGFYEDEDFDDEDFDDLDDDLDDPDEEDYKDKK